jgi:hypothetical protein
LDEKFAKEHDKIIEKMRRVRNPKDNAFPVLPILNGKQSLTVR